MVNLQMNQVMKLLTVMTPSSSPVVHRRSVRHELPAHARTGIAVRLLHRAGVMAAIAIGMLAWLGHRKWL